MNIEDETEGTVTSDSADENDGTLIGVPKWQPDTGYIDGALELDGATYIAADSVLNPDIGPFSVFAWVKGGAPGHAILSQQTGANWLVTDAATGALMSELQSGGRFGWPLYSEMVITDGDWHRIGLTWVGSNRRLCVDNGLAAEDTQSGLRDCSGGLNIGCGNTMAPSTHWIGLVDDVRIYNRAVSP